MTAAGAAPRMAPHVYRKLTTRQMYIRLAAALAVPLAYGMVSHGTSVVWLVLSVLLGCLAADLLAFLLGTVPVWERSLVISMTLTVLLPVSTPPPVALAAGFAAILLGVFLLGGRGQLWVHPAALGVLLVGVMIPVAEETVPGVSVFSAAVVEQWAALVNLYLFEPLGARVPVAAWNLFFGTAVPDGGSLGAGGVLPLLAAAYIIHTDDLVPPLLPIMMVGAFAGTVFLRGGAPFEAMVFSEFLVVAVLMVAEPGMRPLSRVAILLFSVVAGGLMGLLWTIPGVQNPILAANVLASALVPLLDQLSLEALWVRE